MKHGNDASLTICLFLGTLLLAACESAALPFAGRTPANKLTASDTQDGDEFGISVASDGDFAIVGAYSEDGAGDNRGAAYLFDLRSGAELFKLVASDAEDHDRFGVRVSLSGNLAVVSSFREDGAGIDRGAAYVFDLATGEQTYKLVASDAEDTDRFAIDAKISGHYIVVGAWAEDGTGGSSANRGAAYFFDLNNPVSGPNPGELIENRKLTATDASDGNNFGQSVDISGSLAIIGADGVDNEGSSQGAAYIFDLATGVELMKLRASDRQNDDSYGFSVAIYGNRAVVGAYREDGTGTDRGAAYVYDLDTGEEMYKLTAPMPENGAEFGLSVAISKELVAVGARQEDGVGTNRGATYVFDLESGRNLYRLTASDGQDDDRYAEHLSLSDRTLVSTAVWETGDGAVGSKRGAAYVHHIPVHRPDAKVGRSTTTDLGDDLYNSTGAGQALGLTSSRLATVRAFVGLQNDGDISDDLRLTGTAGDRYFAVNYFRLYSILRDNVTAGVVAGTHVEPNLLPGEPDRLLNATISPSQSLKRTKKNRKGKRKVVYLRKRHSLVITARSETFDLFEDTVRINAQTR